MRLSDQVIVVLGLYFLSLLYIRGFLYGVKRYQLNNSAYKKRKKGETFIEWLLYSRYKEEIPMILRVLYYSVLIIHPFSLIACWLVHIIKLPLYIGRMIAISIVIIDTVWMLVIGLLFWGLHDFSYERWITKKRGQKKKQKK